MCGDPHTAVLCAAGLYSVCVRKLVRQSLPGATVTATMCIPILRRVWCLSHSAFRSDMRASIGHRSSSYIRNFGVVQHTHAHRNLPTTMHHVAIRHQAVARRPVARLCLRCSLVTQARLGMVQHQLHRQNPTGRGGATLYIGAICRLMCHIT